MSPHYTTFLLDDGSLLEEGPAGLRITECPVSRLLDHVDPFRDNNWHPYSLCQAPENVLCQFEQRLEPPVKFVCEAKFDHMFHMPELYWRLTGIGKYQLGL